MKLERGPFKEKSFVQALNGGCVPVVFTESLKGWPEVELKDGKKTVKRFKDFPRLTVEEMKALFESADAPKRIDELGEWGTPSYLIVDATGRLLVENLNRAGVSTDAILRDAREAWKKLGDDRATIADYRAFEAGRAAVEAGLDKPDLAPAVKAWRELGRLKSASKRMKEEIEKLSGRLATEGERRLEKAEGPADLRKLADAFAGHPFEKEIRKRLE